MLDQRGLPWSTGEAAGNPRTVKALSIQCDAFNNIKCKMDPVLMIRTENAAFCF